VDCGLELGAEEVVISKERRWGAGKLYGGDCRN